MSMQPVSRDAIVHWVKRRGPLIPNELKKLLQAGDTILLGAMLSELSNKGLVKISNTKLGGSPYYYDPSQPAGLEKIAPHLGEKDQRTWQRLKQEKILRDDEQEALVRVSLRNIKDFAVPLHVNAPGGEVLFWKYFLVSNNEAEALIKRALGMEARTTEEENRRVTPEQKTVVEETVKPTPTPEAKEATKPEPTPTPKDEVAPALKAAPTPEAKPEPTTTPQATPSPKTARSKKKEQKRITEEAQATLPESVEIEDSFYDHVRTYCDEHDITITEATLVRKKRELDLVLSIPTPVGRVEYYCKAKSKKKSNDGDLAAAKLEGSSRDLSTIYLTTGEVTKKAMNALQNKFKGVVVKQL